jgi:hypothetical protein
MKLESKYWLEIAEAFGTPFAKRTERQLKITLRQLVGFRSGLCYALYGYKVIEMELIGNAMGLNGYWWPCTDEGDSDRSDFALLMWAIGEDEFEELAKCQKP